MKNFALVVALIVGIFIFGIVVMMQVPRKSTAAAEVEIMTGQAVASLEKTARGIFRAA